MFSQHCATTPNILDGGKLSMGTRRMILFTDFFSLIHLTNNTREWEYWNCEKHQTLVNQGVCMIKQGFIFLLQIKMIIINDQLNSSSKVNIKIFFFSAWPKTELVHPTCPIVPKNAMMKAEYDSWWGSTSSDWQNRGCSALKTCMMFKDASLRPSVSLPLKQSLCNWGEERSLTAKGCCANRIICIDNQIDSWNSAPILRLLYKVTMCSMN